MGVLGPGGGNWLIDLAPETGNSDTGTTSIPPLVVCHSLFAFKSTDVNFFNVFLDSFLMTRRETNQRTVAACLMRPGWRCCLKSPMILMTCSTSSGFFFLSSDWDALILSHKS